MAVYPLNTLLTRINRFIKQNFNREITGNILQGILHDIVDSIIALIYLRHDIIVISNAGEYQVVFSSVFGTSADRYTLTFNTYDDDGPVSSKIVAGTRTQYGFTIYVDAPCTLEYQAFKI
jgi:hypothetical protein